MITIYLITNEKTGKYYVGQTSYSPTERFRAHLSAARNRVGCPRLRNSMLKHGPEAFSIQVLTETESEIKANELETLWIWALNSTSKSCGYNVSPSGFGTRGLKWRKESRQKLSKTNMGNQRGKGKRCSEEKKEKIRKSLMGHPVSEETKAKIRASMLASPKCRGFSQAERNARKRALNAN